MLTTSFAFLTFFIFRYTEAAVFVVSNGPPGQAPSTVAQPPPPQVTPLVTPKEEKPHPPKPSDKYLVDGAKLPDVPFDIGTSYSGLMPISGAKGEQREFFFWYFPSTLPGGSKDLTIWLNGGPGCSSLFGVVQEHGPFLFPRGSTTAVPNPYSWHKLTNMLYVEQPIGTGFDQGAGKATNENDVSNDFLGFLLQFIRESYAGQYLPYIQRKVYQYVDTVKSTYVLNPKSLFVIEGLLENSSFFQSELATWPFVKANAKYMNLNSTTMQQLETMSANCGYKSYMNTYLKWPAVHVDDFKTNQCNLWKLAHDAARLTNPCFDIYDIKTICPAPLDVLEPQKPTLLNYFSRRDVQDAIHAPHEAWHLCVSPDKVFNPFDTSFGVDNGVLQTLIPRNKRTIWTAADRDFVVMTPGTQLLLNSMFWSGAQGFHEQPSTPFTIAAGKRGIWHEERGLTYVEIYDSGHQIPMFAPESVFKILQYMLLQIPSL